ncbi:unnamed protein product [Discula destructiva]
MALHPNAHRTGVSLTRTFSSLAFPRPTVSLGSRLLTPAHAHQYSSEAPGPASLTADAFADQSTTDDLVQPNPQQQKFVRRILTNAPEGAVPTYANRLAAQRTEKQRRKADQYLDHHMELDPAWWRDMDERCGGPGWIDLLSAHAREAALAKRKHLDQWHSYLEKRYGQTSKTEAIMQSLKLRTEWQLLLGRIRRENKLIANIEQRHRRLDSNITSVAWETYRSLMRLDWYNTLERDYGDDWARIAQANLDQARVWRKFQRNSLRATLNALKKGSQLAQYVERSLAQLRWYDQLEIEHGSEWEQVAEASTAQWMHGWAGSLPTLADEYQRHLVASHSLRLEAQTSLTIFNFWDRMCRRNNERQRGEC